ncbi:NADPH:quinone oxidoreductase [Novosphingobium sediminis]|uniref:NADPH:quinone oxidoreductase n=1 Tax=Novosphingobium sediminis TaxID=707214 RepID=A0A512AG55_9SPHN|nr:NADPH:quinone reductase [Novosphingobium sediminis]GEN98670.1 NADPH:quinone oxidoreductase [Novosphingobium sediminis]
MRAVWYEETGPAAQVLRLGEMETPQPGAGEVRVRLHASGVNPSDVKSRAGLRGPIAFPRVIPHSDGAGVIDAVGEGVSPARIGTRVWVWNSAYRRPFGTSAEYVCLPEVQAVPLPQGTSFEAGACLGIPASTACHAVFADGDVTGQTVLVTGGAGAVGHYAIQLARWGGARVIATVSGPEKARAAQEAGADAVVNYRDGDIANAILAANQGRPVDRVVEVEFGGNLPVTSAVIGDGGVIAAYGSMADAEPKLPFYPLMFRHVTLRMLLVYLLSSQERARMIARLTAALEDGALNHAIAATFDLADSAKAHETVESGRLIGNAVITIP